MTEAPVAEPVDFDRLIAQLQSEFADQRPWNTRAADRGKALVRPRSLRDRLRTLLPIVAAVLLVQGIVPLTTWLLADHSGHLVAVADAPHTVVVTVGSGKPQVGQVHAVTIREYEPTRLGWYWNRVSGVSMVELSAVTDHASKPDANADEPRATNAREDVRSFQQQELSDGQALRASSFAAAEQAVASLLPESAPRLTFDLPKHVIGPSAGLAVALSGYAVAADVDLARGRKIAATGTIDAKGNVGIIADLSLKAQGVRDAGYDVFLVPTSQVQDARNALGGSNVEVIGVSTLQGAVDALAT